MVHGLGKEQGRKDRVFLEGEGGRGGLLEHDDAADEGGPEGGAP
jgi:hypothetical protein